MQTPLEKKGCIKNTWLRRFVIWWTNTDLLPPTRKNIREWGFDLLPSTKKNRHSKKYIYMNELKLSYYWTWLAKSSWAKDVFPSLRKRNFACYWAQI